MKEPDIGFLLSGGCGNQGELSRIRIPVSEEGVVISIGQPEADPDGIGTITHVFILGLTRIMVKRAVP
jgi:hypothetical protein